MVLQQERISLVVFLGNYGEEYKMTRHNAAWLFASSLDFFQNLSWQRKFKGQWAKLGFPGTDGKERPVYFLMPETYMNLSGESAAALADFYKIPAQEILVVHDEIELDFGTLSLKNGGGLGGHNGLRSMKASLGTAGFWRLRIGVGKPSHPDVASYVLSPFSKHEREALPEIFVYAGNLLSSVLTGNPPDFLKEWAKRKILD